MKMKKDSIDLQKHIFVYFQNINDTYNSIFEVMYESMN